MPLDESELEELRRWGQALQEVGGEESVAAGRAILILLEELDRLRLKLRLAGNQPELADEAAGNDIDAEMSDPVGSALHQRLQRALTRDVDDAEARPAPVERIASDADVETDSSARSWIETLRRPK